MHGTYMAFLSNVVFCGFVCRTAVIVVVACSCGCARDMCLWLGGGGCNSCALECKYYLSIIQLLNTSHSEDSETATS